MSRTGQCQCQCQVTNGNKRANTAIAASISRKILRKLHLTVDLLCFHCFVIAVLRFGQNKLSFTQNTCGKVRKLAKTRSNLRAAVLSKCSLVFNSTHTFHYASWVSPSHDLPPKRFPLCQQPSQKVHITGSMRAPYLLTHSPLNDTSFNRSHGAV